MMRRYSVFAMLIWCLFPGILLGSPAGFPTFHVSKIGNDQNEGTEQSPFLTINRGIAALAKKGTGSLIISGGDYRETLQLADLPSGHYVISRKEGSTVRILGSEPLSGWTKAPGMTYVFEIPFSYTVPKWSRHADPIFEDGNPSKKIEPRHSHPLQKNLSYRLPFTDIIAVADINTVDQTPGSYCINGQKLYLHASNSTDPNTNGFSYETIIRSANTYNQAPGNMEVSLEITGLQFFYTLSGFQCRGFRKVVRHHCVSMATPAAGAFRNDTGSVETYYEEAAFCNGDGENSHFAAFTDFKNLTDNRSNYPTVKHYGLWSHDNFDDGESSHEHHNVYIDAALLEFNGDSGCRPSNDATYYVSNSIFRNNGWEVGHGGGANKGEGFAVVNPVSGPSRMGCRALLFNCISEENNTGFGNLSSASNILELVNCISRNNTSAELFTSAGTIISRNTLVTNPDKAKWKVAASTGNIQVLNDHLLP